jgi:hypothetical protein
MKKAFVVPAALAALALPTQSIAQKASECLSPAEAQSLLVVALPDIVSAVTDKCKAVVGPKAYLARSGADLVARYRASGSESWPAARKAISKMVGAEAKLLEALPDEAMRGFFSAGVTTAVAGDIKPETCGDIDRGISALAPLPPENIASLIGLILEMDSRRKSKDGAKAKGPLNICPAPTAGSTVAATK